MTRVLRRGTLPAVNVVICLFLLAPIIVVIGASLTTTNYFAFPPHGLTLHWYDELVHNADMRDAAVVSLQVGLIATLLAMAIGVPAAIALTRSDVVARGWFRGLLLAPLIVPGIVAGIGILIFFSKIGLTGTFRGLVLAHTVIVLPYIVLVVTSGLEATDRSAEAAARSLGAGPIRAFCEITLPALSTSLVAGALFGFLTSLDETVVTLFLVGPSTSTLPVSVFNYVQFNSDPVPAALATVLIAVTVAIMLAIDRLVGLRRVV